MATGDPENPEKKKKAEEDPGLSLEPETGTFEIRRNPVPEREPDLGPFAPTKTGEPGPPTSMTEPATGTLEVGGRRGDDFATPTIAPMSGSKVKYSEAVVLTEDEIRPPSLNPFTPLRFLAWPLTGEHAPDVLAKCFRTLLICAGAWLLGTAPYAGPPLRGLIECIAAFTVFFYLVRVTLAGIEGKPEPPPFVRLSLETDAVADSWRALFLFALHLLPGLLVAGAMSFDPFALGRTPLSVFLFYALLLAGWYLFPASLLVLAASGKVSGVRPAFVLQAAWSGGIPYFLNALPGAAILVIRLLFWPVKGGDFFGAILEGLAFPVLVYTALVVGTIAREKPHVTDVVLAANKLAEEAEPPAR